MNPLTVSFEPMGDDFALAYVRYRESPADGVVRTQRLSESVLADVDRDGAVIAIEVIVVNEDNLAIASAFAKNNGLAFPRDLMGCYTQIAETGTPATT